MTDSKKTNKQEMITQLIAMQKQFIEFEQKEGLDPQQYYAPEEGEALHGYKEKFDEIAAQVRDSAHKEKGSTQ